MNTDYGEVKYLWDTGEYQYIYVYGISNNVVKAAIDVDAPRYSLIRQDKFGNKYFKKDKYRVFINELEEIG